MSVAFASKEFPPVIRSSTGFFAVGFYAYNGFMGSLAPNAISPSLFTLKDMMRESVLQFVEKRGDLLGDSKVKGETINEKWTHFHQLLNASKETRPGKAIIHITYLYMNDGTSQTIDTEVFGDHKPV